jgi:hypothetical protein
MIIALKMVSPPIGSILLTLFVRTINGIHIFEASIIVQYRLLYDDGFQAKNGSVQLKIRLFLSTFRLGITGIFD